MDWLFKYRYSTSHMFVPRIVIAILIILGICIIALKIHKRIKNNEPVFQWKSFFKEDYDKLKFWGSIVLFVLYVYTLDKLHFVLSSLIFIFLFNVLFCGTLKPKSLAVSAATTAIFVIGTYYIFGKAFNITLP